MIRKSLLNNVLIIVVMFLIYFLSVYFGFDTGISISEKFVQFSKNLVFLVPVVFILLGLFEVWIKRETIEKHLGVDSGIKGILWAILLASTSIGGMYVAFPIAHTLYQKGARLSVLFTYLGAAALCRIPMTLFEATFLGVKFTLIRLIISIPLVVISSVILSKYLEHIGFEIRDDR